MKIRIKFRKTGLMKFVGHLDLMRFFQKAFRRAEVDLVYSKGFNPHPEMSFASPLGIGLTSEGEYLDLLVNTCESSEEMIRGLNQEMPEGIEILSWRVLKDSSKNAMSIVAAAAYRVSLPSDLELAERVAALMAQPEIKVLKKTKSSENEVDIKPMILSLKAEDERTLTMLLAAGSVANLKPELVLGELWKLGATVDMPAYQLHRVDLYAREKDELVSMNDMLGSGE